jgi:hypothetical protein
MRQHEQRDQESLDRVDTYRSQETWDGPRSSEVLDTESLRPEDQDIPEESADDATDWHERVDPVARNGPAAPPD